MSSQRHFDSVDVKLCFTRQTDHDLSETSNQGCSNLLIQKHEVCDRGARKANAQPLRCSGCSASGAGRTTHEEEEPTDHHDLDQYLEKK